jgi:hypothetical protein
MTNDDADADADADHTTTTPLQYHHRYFACSHRRPTAI